MQCRPLCLLLLVALACICPLCIATNVQPCESTAGTFKRLDLVGCVDSEADVCELKRGSNSTTVFHFTPLKPTKVVTVEMFSIMGKIKMDIELKYPNLCTDPDGGLNCPLDANADYSYKIDIHIIKTVPKVRCDILWEFRNDAGELILCILVPVKILRADDE